MKFTPTKEQSHIVATASTGVDVIIQAYAGASKTSTLVLVAEELKDKRILYLAFNKSIATEAQEKMPYNVDCRTVHSVAYQHTDKAILKKLRYNQHYQTQFVLDTNRRSSCSLKSYQKHYNLYRLVCVFDIFH